MAEAFGAFASKLYDCDIPADVRTMGAHLLLDAIGVALPASRLAFAQKAESALRRLGDGEAGACTVLGIPRPMPIRDAAHMNGMLIHGIDFDDTYPPGVIHPSSAVVPAVLASGEVRRASGRDVLTAYILGMEVACRISAATGTALHHAGYHPTGVVGAFAAAVAAGRLAGLTGAELAQAQGFVGSLAAGSLQFLEGGAWTKRSQPGWAAKCGVTAAAFAEEGFPSPRLPYEGRFGIFATHLGERDTGLRPRVSDMGDAWEFLRTAVKPYPACHLIHAFLDAALILRQRYDLEPKNIRLVTCLIAAGEVATVCEPYADKTQPKSGYEASFSLPFSVATALVRGRFGVHEVMDEVVHDSCVLALANRVAYTDDPHSRYPEAFSGEVWIETTEGIVLRHREEINRGALDRALSLEEIEAKFLRNATSVMAESEACRLMARIIGLDDLADIRELSGLLR